MDPLSIVAGIVAVGQATGAIGKCAKTLYQISKNAGVLAQDVKLFASHVDVFGSTISNVHCTVRDHYMRDSNSIALQRLRDYSTLNVLASQSRNLIRRVDGLQPHLKGRGKSMDLLERFRWVRKKEERREIGIWMDRVQVSFLLIMHQVMYEALQQRASNPSFLERELCDFREELRKHKRMMRTHMKTMRVLRDEQEYVTPRQSERYEQDRDIEMAFVNAERMLFDLGRDIVSDEVSNLSPGASSVSASTVSRLSDQATRREVQENHTPATFSQLRGPQFQRRSAQVSRRGERDSNLRIATHPASAVPPDQGTPQRSRSLPETSLRESNEVQPGFREDSDYMAVPKSVNLLHLDPNLNSEAIAGYINSNTRSTTVLLNPEFPQNIISQEAAVNLHLHIDELDENEDGIEIDVGKGVRQTVRGKVTFVWKKGSGNASLGERPLKVTCLVCEHTPRAVIFGQLFLRRRRQYWKE